MLCAITVLPTAAAQHLPGATEIGKADAPLLISAEFAPSHLFAPPPPRKSAIEALEMQRLRAMRAGSTPARIAQAEKDGHDESPDVFSAAAGRDLTRLPATMALLARVQLETGRIIKAGKLYFKRLRPYGVDPSLPHCGKGKTLDNSYPSGHAGFAWSVGWTLARLIPDRAPEILARTQDYALSREICGAHFPSDIEASHAAAMLVAERLLSDPRLAGQIAAARRELAQP